MQCLETLQLDSNSATDGLRREGELHLLKLWDHIARQVNDMATDSIFVDTKGETIG
jgi:hypothetical protein